MPVSHGDTKHTDEILGILILPSITGGHNPISNGWKGYPGTAAHRRRKINMLPGAGPGVGRDMHSGFSAYCLDERSG